MLITILSSLLLSAQATPPADPQAAAPNRNGDRAMTCRREQVVGSNRTRTVCMTNRERDRRQEQAQRNVDTLTHDRATPESETNPGH